MIIIVLTLQSLQNIDTEVPKIPYLPATFFIYALKCDAVHTCAQLTGTQIRTVNGNSFLKKIHLNLCPKVS